MILSGDALSQLATLPDGSLDSCVTSTPYWGLRDYGTVPVLWPEVTFRPVAGLPTVTILEQACELGQEADPWAYVAHMVQVFREVYRVLKPGGVLLLNLGDSYESKGRRHHFGSDKSTLSRNGGTGNNPKAQLMGAVPAFSTGVGEKQLLGIPWRVALALQADGWTLRQDIIWHKPNPMPESVVDRCTKAHEYIFLLSKGSQYYWDKNAISETAVGNQPGNLTHKHTTAFEQGDETARLKSGLVEYSNGRKQTARAVQLAKEGGLTPEHLEALRAVGLSDTGRGKQLQSGSGQNDPEILKLADEARVVLGSYAREFLSSGGRSARDSFKRENSKRAAVMPGQSVGTHRPDRIESEWPLDTRNRRSVWSIPTMPFKEAHFAVMAPALARDLILASTPAGGTVLDPFLGSGTTLREALKLGRECIGIELKPENVALAKRMKVNTGLGLIGEAL